jgi:hypothetical protein
MAVLLVGLVACSRAGAPETEVTTSPPAVKAPPPKPPVTAPAAPQVTVEMTAATLADACGDAPPMRPPVPREKTADRLESPAQRSRSSVSRGVRACEQTSMQLAVASPATAQPVQIAVKKVELYDASGKLLGELAARLPTVWTDASSAYKPWDQKVAAGAQLSVSYLLSPPDWGAIGGRRAVMYTVKAVITIGGTETTVQHDVEIEAETTLPPNVRT